MFRLFLPTIIRELHSLTKVTLVIFVYDGNGMMAACRLMYTMFLDMALPGVLRPLQDLQRTKDMGKMLSKTRFFWSVVLSSLMMVVAVTKTSQHIAWLYQYSLTLQSCA